ncbi:MAG: Tethering factor for nuclear proteasome sts1 [Stictis urceolatum]|nr:Tethering factor for nuclear proteasome sts1 [Stictis urceolata]
MSSILLPVPPRPSQFHHKSKLQGLKSSNITLTCAKVSLISPSMNNRKRKADDDSDERMSTSPTASPSLPTQQLSTHRPNKKARSGIAGRPLTLPRLLETLDADSLRSVMKSLCEAHPSIIQDVVKIAPRPSVQSALEVLHKYQSNLQSAFPFGGDSASDYAYNRVKQQLSLLLEALGDFTPHFLPPNESHVATSLEFLDGATSIVHRLPNWHSFSNNLAKNNAYEEIARAWVAVIQEAAKKAAGISLRYDAWDKKLAKHNEIAQGRLQSVIDELGRILIWTGASASTQAYRGSDTNSAVQELLSGTYGTNVPVRVGPW